MKICLLELTHTTCGVHASNVPLAIGLLSAYLKKNLDETLDIRLYKEIDEFVEELKLWTPDIVGISQYSWNTNLDLYAAGLAKKANPNCIVIAGGPNLDIEEDRRIKYFQKNPQVDICVEKDGEIPFLEIVKRVLNGENIKSLIKDLPAGTFSFDQANKTYHESNKPVPRLDSIDAYGSVYKDGVFNKFLDKGYHPFILTTKGCPFTCAFCHTGTSYHSKMLFLSPEIFREEMEYLAKRYQNRHDVILYLSNSNFSMFEEETEHAYIIKEMQEKYNWPKYFDVTSGKNTQKLLDMLSIIKFSASISLQTLTPEVLKNIRRKNIPFEEYMNFQKQVKYLTGALTQTELIIGLPGETKESFMNTLIKCIDSGVDIIVIYTLMNLQGTPISSDEFTKKYQHVIKHRIVPRQYSIVNGDKIFDTEEVIIGTKYMSFDDYLEIRNLCFTLSIIFNSLEIAPLKRFLIEQNIELSKWIFGIHKSIKTIPEIYELYQEFSKETREELFDSKEELTNYFEKEENFNDLISGKKGDNLMRKYKCLALSQNYEMIVKLAIETARKFVQNNNEKAEELLNDIQTYLLTRDLKPILADHMQDINFSKTICLNYDIPTWLDSDMHLESFKGKFKYEVKLSEFQKQSLNDFIHNRKNLDLSLQILYFNGAVIDLWPKCIKQHAEKVC